MATLATLSVMFTADTASFQRKMEKTARESARLERSLKLATKPLEDMERYGRRASLALAAVTAAITVGISKAARYASEIKRVSDSTGLAVETVQELRFAAGEANVEFSQLESGMRALLRRSALAARGNQQYLRSFQRIGISQTDLNENLDDVEELFLRVAQGVGSLNSEAEMAAVLMDTMGDSGRRLIPMFLQGRQGIEDWVRQAREMRIILDEDLILGFDALGGAVGRTGQRAQTAGQQFLGHFLAPAFVVNEWIDRGISLWNDLDEEMHKNVARWLAIAAGVLAVIGVLGVLAGALRSTIVVFRMVGLASMVSLAGPFILGLALVGAGAVAAKAAWDSNLFGIQETTERVVSGVTTAWNRMVGLFRGRDDILTPGIPIGPGAALSEGAGIRLPELPTPNWAGVIETGRANVQAKLAEVREEVASFTWPTIQPFAWPSVEPFVWPDIEPLEWPALPPVPVPDTSPLRAEWFALKLWVTDPQNRIAFPSIEMPPVPRIETGDFLDSWEQFRNEVSLLEAPDIPEDIKDLLRGIIESPGGQTTINVGTLAREVLAGDKTLNEALGEALESSIAIPLTAGAAVGLTRYLGAGWKLSLGVGAVAIVLPKAIENRDELAGLFVDLWRQLGDVLALDADTPLSDVRLNLDDPLVQAIQQQMEAAGRRLGAVVGDFIVWAIQQTIEVPDFAVRISAVAVAIGRAVSDVFIEPFVRGFSEELTARIAEVIPQAILDGLEQARNLVSGAQPDLVQVLEDPGAAARQFASQTEGLQTEVRGPLTPMERLMGTLRGWRDAIGFREGTPWTGRGPLGEVAGVVHRQEAVIPWKALRKGVAGVLDFLGIRGFQDGKAPTAALAGVTATAAIEPAEAGLLRTLLEQARSLVGQAEERGWIDDARATQFLGVVDGLETGLQTIDAEVSRLFGAFADGQDIIDAAIGAADRHRQALQDLAAAEEDALRRQQYRDRLESMFLAQMPELNNAVGVFRDTLALTGDPLTAFATSILALALASEPLENVFRVLSVPVKIVAEAFGHTLAPILKATFPALKFFGQIVLAVGSAVNRVARTIIAVVHGIARALANINFLGIRPFSALDGIVRTLGNTIGELDEGFKEMQRASWELSQLTWEEAEAKAGLVDEVNRLSNALHNVPLGFRALNALRFQAGGQMIESFGTGGYIPPTPGGRIIRVAEAGEGEYVVPESQMGGDLNISIGTMHVEDGRDFGRKLDEELRRRGLRRSGNSGGLQRVGR